MPTYAYACKDCGHAFDIQQSFSEDSLTVCPECRGTLRKKFNSVGVVFKGSGFYRTDSRSSSSSVPATPAGGADAPASPAPASPAPGKAAPGKTQVTAAAGAPSTPSSSSASASPAA